MLEKPDFPDEKIITCLQVEYGLDIVQVVFLPLGGDLSTAVYRGVTDDDTPYFCKLKREFFDETAVSLPRFLSEQGIAEIIPPLATQSGQLWAKLDEFNLILYPFVAGTAGYELELSERQWADFGAALKRIHTTTIPPTISRNIPREDYSPEWRERCRQIFKRLDDETFADPIMADMAVLLHSKRAMILNAVERAEQLAHAMSTRAMEFVLCHSDIHPGNLFIDTKGTLFIVDWDYPMLAPKERDLMFIGGGQGFIPYIAEQEETLFYRGYGRTPLDPMALAYYRYERGITDISVECERILLDTLGDQDRAQALQYVQYYLLPGGTIEMAYKSDNTRM
ncbi:MAG TPA: aminoglycoside phosphotransferase family protein [Chloroflexota bacterium]|nr:aminoglycoside phosphotransferase family protein [Chloroflexota bacterium]